MHLICKQGRYVTAAHGLNHMLKRTYVHGLPQTEAQLDSRYVHAQHDCNHVPRRCSLTQHTPIQLETESRQKSNPQSNRRQVKVKVTQVLVNKLANR